MKKKAVRADAILPNQRAWRRYKYECKSGLYINVCPSFRFLAERIPASFTESPSKFIHLIRFKGYCQQSHVARWLLEKRGAMTRPSRGWIQGWIQGWNANTDAHSGDQ
jgi:hypothetical protein